MNVDTTTHQAIGQNSKSNNQSIDIKALCLFEMIHDTTRAFTSA